MAHIIHFHCSGLSIAADVMYLHLTDDQLNLVNKTWSNNIPMSCISIGNFPNQ